MARSSLVLPSHEPDADGTLVSVTPEQAGWRDLSFAARRLQAGQRFAAATGDCELGLVLLGGRATIESSAGRWESIGRRRNVFDGLPFALYLPRGVAYTIAAETDLEVALAWCPAGAAEEQPPLQARLITPEEVNVEVRGGGNATRQINNLMLGDFPARRLLIVEVYTPSGNWSSYPPHKHDVHDPPREVCLEEVYYYRTSHLDGYALQQVYSSERGLDELIRARDGDLVLIPYGYHPVVAPPGYDVYYFNALAGSAHEMTAADEPRYAWVRGSLPAPDPRVPLIREPNKE
jgi:5-deoxy-glucuronate isomerase